MDRGGGGGKSDLFLPMAKKKVNERSHIPFSESPLVILNSTACIGVPVGKPLHPLVHDPLDPVHHGAGHVQSPGVRFAGGGEVVPK